MIITRKRKREIDLQNFLWNIPDIPFKKIVLYVLQPYDTIPDPMLLCGISVHLYISWMKLFFRKNKDISTSTLDKCLDKLEVRWNHQPSAKSRLISNRETCKLVLETMFVSYLMFLNDAKLPNIRECITLNKKFSNPGNGNNGFIIFLEKYKFVRRRLHTTLMICNWQREIQDFVSKLDVLTS